MIPQEVHEITQILMNMLKLPEKAATPVAWVIYNQMEFCKCP